MMRILFASLLALLLAGCAATPPRLFAGADPTDPRASVPPQPYRSALSDYVPRRPVEPSAWPGTNERIAPQPRSTP